MSYMYILYVRWRKPYLKVQGSVLDLRRVAFAYSDAYLHAPNSFWTNVPQKTIAHPPVSLCIVKQ